MTEVLRIPLGGEPDPDIVGCSAALLRALELADRFAPSSIPVLIVGATGTGKELLARRIHVRSGRCGEFVDLNCASMPREMFESLLFGHRRGAFTGAVECVAGLLEHASGGTVFLDEITSLPVEVQAKLLRVLEHQELRRLGEAKKRALDFRVVAAAQVDLNDRVQHGQFRLDLYQRVAGVVLTLPPLIERPEDLLLLAHHFATEHARVLGDETEPLLLTHSWPGNVRELRAAIGRAVLMTDDGPISSAALSEAIALGALSNDGGNQRTYHRRAQMRSCVSLDRDQLLTALESASWDVAALAQALGISRATAYRRLRSLGITSGSVSPSQSH